MSEWNARTWIPAGERIEQPPCSFCGAESEGHFYATEHHEGLGDVVVLDCCHLCPEHTKLVWGP